jgi:DNA-binding NarL/FixJ family response regulator
MSESTDTKAIRTLQLEHPEAEIMLISLLGEHYTVIREIDGDATEVVPKNNNHPFSLAIIQKIVACGPPPGPTSIPRDIRRVTNSVSETVQKDGNIKVKNLPEKLTLRETEILQGLVRGLTNAGLASAYNISKNTVPVHIRNIYRKLKTRNRAETVYQAIYLGLANT